jgi:hypothetical protein
MTNKVNEFGNASGDAPVVPATPINGGGLTIAEIAQSEAALVAADNERAAAAAVAAPTLAAFDRQGGGQ